MKYTQLIDYKQQQEFRKRFKKRAEQEFSEYLKNFNDAQKKKFFDGVDELITPQLEEMQATQKRIKRRQEDIHFFSFSIVVAIISGCVANILHDALKEWGTLVCDSGNCAFCPHLIRG